MAERMDKEERWNQFAATGKVTDYLKYCSERQMTAASTEESKQYERNSDIDRNGHYRITDERVR